MYDHLIEEGRFSEAEAKEVAYALVVRGSFSISTSSRTDGLGFRVTGRCSIPSFQEHHSSRSQTGEHSLPHAAWIRRNGRLCRVGLWTGSAARCARLCVAYSLFVTSLVSHTCFVANRGRCDQVDRQDTLLPSSSLPRRLTRFNTNLESVESTPTKATVFPQICGQ